MFVILTYDVNVKRVSKVMKTCRKYLSHVQNSVLEGSITEKNLNKLAVSINSIKKLLPEFEPFSDVWCRAQNILTELQSRWEFQFEKLYGNKADNGKR